jgi:hypothetical protein
MTFCGKELTGGGLPKTMTVGVRSAHGSECVGGGRRLALHVHNIGALNER